MEIHKSINDAHLIISPGCTLWRRLRRKRAVRINLPEGGLLAYLPRDSIFAGDQDRRMARIIQGALAIFSWHCLLAGMS